MLALVATRPCPDFDAAACLRRDECVVRSRATLVVAPSQLVAQWYHEASQYCPRLKAYMIRSGRSGDRRRQLASAAAASLYGEYHFAFSLFFPLQHLRRPQARDVPRTRRG